MLTTAALAVTIHVYLRRQCCNEYIAIHQRTLAKMLEVLPRVERIARVMREHPEQILEWPQHGSGLREQVYAIEKQRSLIRAYERAKWMFWERLPDDRLRHKSDALR
jgi:hypothetical protein